MDAHIRELVISLGQPLQQLVKYLMKSIRVIIQVSYDDFVVLPSNEEECKAELNAFLEDRAFPCIGAFDG